MNTNPMRQIMGNLHITINLLEKRKKICLEIGKFLHRRTYEMKTNPLRQRLVTGQESEA